MKRLLSILTLAGVLATPTVQAADWTGAYVGGLASFNNSGDVLYYENGVWDDDTWPVEGTQYGAFAGYNMSYGTFVVGGEIAYSAGSVFQTGYPTYELTDFIDLKARVGATSGEALIYGVVGWSTGTHDEGGDELVTMSGLNYGVGADFLVTDSIFIGAEYLFRDLSGDFSGEIWSMDADIQSIQLRVGMKF